MPKDFHGLNKRGSSRVVVKICLNRQINLKKVSMFLILREKTLADCLCPSTSSRRDGCKGQAAYGKKYNAEIGEARSRGDRKYGEKKGSECIVSGRSSWPSLSTDPYGPENGFQ